MVFRMFPGDANATVFTRVDHLTGKLGTVGFAWNALQEAFYGEHARGRLILIDYEALTRQLRVLAPSFSGRFRAMEITLLGTGAPLHPDRAMTGVIVTAPDCAPLLIDTCGGLELARQLELVGFDRADLRAVIVTHRHLDHAGGIQDLLLARMPLEIYALPDTHEGIAAVTQGSFPEWELHPDIARHEIWPGLTREIEGFQVKFFTAKHRVPTVAVRISADGRTFAFSADTVACEDIVGCAKNADLFLCERCVPISTARRLRRALVAPCMRPRERLR